MLGEKLLHAGTLCAVCELIHRRVAFLNSDDFLRGDFGQNFSKSPDAAPVCRIERRLALRPQLLQALGIQSRRLLLIPSGKHDLQQVPAMLTSETVGQCDAAAADTAQLGYTLPSFDRLF